MLNSVRKEQSFACLNSSSSEMKSYDIKQKMNHEKWLEIYLFNCGNNERIDNSSSLDRKPFFFFLKSLSNPPFPLLQHPTENFITVASKLAATRAEIVFQL